MDLSLQLTIVRLPFTCNFRFNPCFNGSFTSTISSPDNLLTITPIVSILVLMDLSLQHCFYARLKYLEGLVSILVLMDLSLQPGLLTVVIMVQRGFNPCFNGSFTSTLYFHGQLGKLRAVSILVLMDLSLQLFCLW